MELCGSGNKELIHGAFVGFGIKELIHGAFVGLGSRSFHGVWDQEVDPWSFSRSGIKELP